MQLQRRHVPRLDRQKAALRSVRGRDRYIQFNREYPGDWHVTPTQILVDGDAGVARFDFWPEPYDPPAGREHLVERW